MGPMVLAQEGAPDFPVLTALVLVPAVGAVAVALIPRARAERGGKAWAGLVRLRGLLHESQVFWCSSASPAGATEPERGRRVSGRRPTSWMLQTSEHCARRAPRVALAHDGALVVLAVLAIAGGVINLPFNDDVELPRALPRAGAGRERGGDRGVHGRQGRLGGDRGRSGAGRHRPRRGGVPAPPGAGDRARGAGARLVLRRGGDGVHGRTGQEVVRRHRLVRRPHHRRCGERRGRGGPYRRWAAAVRCSRDSSARMPWA